MGDDRERPRFSEIPAETRLSSLLESSDDAIIGESLDGVIAAWNAGAERLFGYTAAEALGKHGAILMPPARIDDEYRIFDQLRKGVAHGRFEAVRRRKDGKDVDVSISIAPVRDASGKVVGAWKVLRDVSARRRSERELAQARDEAEVARRELEVFRYSVAHDLRAPLRSIDGFSLALLEDHPDKLDPGAHADLRRVRESAQRMAKLIEHLLALTQLAQRRVRWERVDLGVLARATVDRLRRADPERAVDVEVEEGLVATGDASLLALLLDHLIGNAWKFSSKKASARIEFRRSEENGEIVYSVRDTGAGFDMAYADKLFGVFQRLHTTTEFEGIGVGLATVQRIVRRHGGRVWALGAVGEGAVFFFTLPEREEHTWATR